MFPEEALREALLNAIAHEDYASCIPIQISVYEDKIMLWNQGYLPATWTVEKLFEKHSSEPYNPDVASAFFRAGHIESWGQGILKIIKACKKEEKPEPVFSYDAPGFTVTFEAGIEKTVEKTVVKNSMNLILEAIKLNPVVSSPDLQKITGLTRRGVEWNIQKLKREKKLKRIGPDKGGYWKVL